MRMRIFGLAAILLLAVQTSHAEDKKITIWWAQWDPAAALQELGHEFAEETGIAVEVYQIPWPAYQDQVFLNFRQQADRLRHRRRGQPMDRSRRDQGAVCGVDGLAARGR